MQLIERVQSILLRPKQTWPVIAAESSTVQSLYVQYLAILAAIPAVAKFIGFSLIGMSGFGVSFRVPILAGLAQMIVGYLLSLAMFFVLALIVDALAPTFGGVKNQVQALKLVAYSSTAALLGGIFYLLPALSLLALVAACYSIYLLYTGISVLMRCPADKAAAYTAVVIVCAVVVGIVIGAVLALFGAGAAGGGFGRGMAAAPIGNVTVNTPDGGNVTINGGAMAEMARRMETAGKKMEAAEKSGDSAAAKKAMGDMMGVVMGGTSTPIPAAELKAALPEAVGGLRRNSIEASGGEAMGIAATSAKASYVNGEQQLRLTVTDTGGLGGLANFAAWANVTLDKETDGKVEKVYKDGGRTVHEEYRKDGSHGEYSLILGNGVVVAADGNGVGIDDLKKAVASLDLGRLESTQRAAK